jgi:hypothetical protein
MIAAVHEGRNGGLWAPGLFLELLLRHLLGGVSDRFDMYECSKHF